jgi:DNA-binding response OmpR family regulator
MSYRKKTALIIEDDYSIFLVLELMLQDKDIRSVHADSISATERLVNQVSPDYIFIDHFLPDGFGIDFIPVLRKKFSKSLIIAMTAQNSPENKILAASNGSDFFLEKPFGLTDVYRSINSA